MANQEYNDHEEEYHYVDDQPEYELDHDQKVIEKEIADDNFRKRFVNKLKQNKRIVLGVLVFLLLLFIVYRMIVPVNQTANVDLTEGQTLVGNSVKKTNATHVALTKTNEVKPIATNQTITSPRAIPEAAISGVDQIKQLSDRVVSLEQQNTAIMNLLQTQFMQKISDADAERSQMRSQMRQLESHVDTMESAFHQLVKLIEASSLSKEHAQQTTSVQAGSANAGGDETASQVAANYTVQAIIPGRAWLKSASGDTLTVADGDNLKGLGRVTRIDPYDGVVIIDTGKKMITLTYGVGGDQS